MINVDQLKQKREELAVSLGQLNAELFAHQGALRLLDNLISEAERAPMPEDIQTSGEGAPGACG